MRERECLQVQDHRRSPRASGRWALRAVLAQTYVAPESLLGGEHLRGLVFHRAHFAKPLVRAHFMEVGRW